MASHFEEVLAVRKTVQVGSSGQETPAMVESRKRTFITWVNKKLKSRGIRIQNLTEDFENGIVLIRLLECLAPGKKMPGRYYARPVIKIQKVQNLAIAFKFITEVEKISVNNVIQPKHILEQDEYSVILLLWLLILHYEIGYKMVTGATLEAAVLALKRSLLTWINCVLPGQNVTNFNADWKDGRNLSALINYCEPGLIPDHASLKASNATQNVQKAIALASSRLGVESFMAAEEFALEKPDEISMMMYLAQFSASGQRILLLWIQQQIPDENIVNFSDSWTSGKALGALTNAVSGGKFPGYVDMTADTALANVEQAMLAAEKMLGVRRTVTPAMFSEVELNELFRLSYLAQFQRAKENSDALLAIPAAADKVEVSDVQIPSTIGGEKCVWVELDCSDAGYGDVKAEVQGRNAGSIPATVKEVEGDKYRVSFVPPSVDVYDFSIRYGTEHVTGSPFSVNLYPPNPEKVKHSGTTDNSETGQDVALNFETKEAGRGKLSARAEGEVSGTTPVKIVPLGDGSFAVSFHPQFPDIYTVDVFWGKFAAQAVGEVTGPVALQVNQDKKSEYLVSFKPPNPDIYMVDVSWDGKPVPGSPFMVDLLPPPMAQEVECAVPIYSEPGEVAELLVDTSTAGSGQIKTACTGENVGDVPVELSKIAGRTYQCTFTPPENDLYTLDVLFDDTHVKGSPFKIDMRPGVVQEFGEIHETALLETAPDATKCILLDPPKLGKVVPIGKPLFFSVDCSQAGPGELEVIAGGTGMKENPPDITVSQRPHDKGVFDVTFIAKVPSSYTLSLTWFNDPIPNTPLQMSAIDPSAIVYFHHGKPVSVDCEVEGKSGDLKAFAIHDETDAQYKVKSTKTHKNKYKLSFSPKDPGLYRIHVTMKDKEIRESPIIVNYGKPPKPSACKVEGFDLRCYIGEPIRFTVDATEAGSGDLVVKPGGPKPKKDKSEITVTDNRNGVFSVEYTPLSMGDHSFSVTWAGKSIPGSPFVTVATQRTSDITTDVYLVENYSKPTQSEKPVPVSEDTIISLIGNPLLVRVAVCDELKDQEFTANAVGKETGPTDVAVTKLSSNVHEILLNPDAQDVYTVTAKVGDKEVPRSPVDVNYVTPASDPSKCFIVGIKELPPTLYVDKPISFKVHTEHAGPGDLGVTVDAPPTEEPPSVNVTQSPVDFVYDVSYTPKAPGQHSLSFLWAGDKIPDSPVQLKVSEPPTYGFGQPVGMDISADCKPGDLEAHAVHVDSNTPYKVKISKVHKGKYKLTLEPKDPGYYHIHVLLKQKEIPGSPFVVKYGEPAKPEKCTIHGQPDSVYVNRPINFVVDAKEAGSGKLSISASVPKSEPDVSKPELKVKDNKDGTFGVEYVPNTVGKHSFGVLWSGQEIPDSPINVDVREEGMDLTDLIDDFISSTPQSLPIDEVIEAAPAAEVESGNPAVCAVPEEPPIKVERRPNPIIIVIGKALKLKVKPKDDIQRNGTLRARAEGETTGPAEVKTSQNEEGVFEVHFNPQQPDYYVVEVKLNDENVPQSPFHVLYLPAPDQEPTVEAPGTEQLEAVFIPDKPIDYQIDLSGVPSGSLSAKCVGEECGSVPVTYEPITPDSKKYKVAFVPPQPDLYHLSVFFNDKELKGSPYDIDLRRKKIEEPVDNVRLQETVENIPVPEDDSFLPDYKEDTPASDTVSEHDHTVEDVPSEEFTVFVGTPLAVKVHPKSDKQRNGELAATAIGDSVGSTDISCIRRDDILFARFDPKEPDRYTIDVKINDESVPRSPFRVNYIMPPTDASKCRLIGVKDIEDFVEVGTDVNLRVDSKKAGVGNLEVSAERPAEEEVASMLSASPSQKEWGLYDVVYIPQSHGKHSLDLKWADQTIPHSPVQILAVDSNRTETVPNGKAASVDIDADGNLKAHCIHKETNQNYKVKISKIHKGKYRITFQPKDIGLYFVHAYIKDKELPQSPFIIRYARPSKPEACKVLGLHDRCYLGETVSFKVDTREAGDGGLHIKTVGPDGKETAERLQLTDNKDGIHSAELTPAVPGMHELEITWGGKPVPGQPFPLFVRDHSKEELLSWLFDIDRVGDFHSVNFPAEGEELLDTTDHTLLLRVLARTEEQKREQLTVTAANSETGEKTSFAVTKKGEDTFEARFIPTVPQMYTIEAQLGASPVPHTPFKIKYETPKADAGKCQILGLEKHPDRFQANRPIVFQVDTRLAGNGKLNLAAEGVQLKPKLEARASKEDTRIIDVTYTPTAPGTHHLKVLWSGEPVAKSPLTFPVEAVPRFPHGKSVGYDLDIDAKQGDIDAHAIHVDTNSRLKVKTSKVSKGKYRFSFSPKKIGLYALHIFVKKREIKQSPIYILYEGPPKPEACVVKDVPNEWYIHEQGSFIVDATEAGSSSLSVKVSSPSRGKEGEVKVTNNEDGTHTVEHTPEMLGNHKFSLTWAGKAIPDSPVTTSVKKRVPKAKACLGPYVNVVPVGERVELDVVNLGRYVGDSNYVTATARGKVGSDQPEVVDKDGLCIVNFVPTVADDYTLSVKIHDEDIEGSPFLIKSVDKPCLSKDYAPVEEACFSDVEVGKEVCLVVPKDEALPPGSEPVVEARGPEGPCEMKLIDQVESSYGVNFTPTVPGDYLVHVKKDKESEAEIESSPFKIRAIEKKSDAHKVIIPDSFQQLLVDPIPLGTSVKFEINTSEAGYGTLKVRQSGEGKATIKLTEEKDATYACSLVPTQIGSCQLDILWNDDHIRGSPLKLTFVPEPITTDVYLVENYSKPTQSEKPVPVSEDPITSLIGNPLLVRVTVCDELKDKEFTANAVGKETGPTDVAVTKLSSNVHEILLNPDAQDVYTVTAKVGDKEVPRSPVDVNYVTPASDPSKCFIVGIKELPPTLYVDKPISFKVHTEHAGPGDLGVTVDAPPTEEPPSVNVTQSPVDFVYDISYTPKAPGQHSLSFLWAGDKIPDSPVQLKVSEPPTYGFGQPVGMDISADCKPGDLEAHAVHVDSNTPYKVKISKVHKGKYKLTLEPKDPGYYHIHVLLKQKEIPGSPFVVKYGEPAKPEKCTIHGQPDSVYVNRPINFVVDAKEAGSGKLSISASVPKSEPDVSKPELKVKDNKDGTFGVEYVPNTVGKHSFGVLWSGQEIPDSPVNVDVREEGMDLTDLIDDFISSTPQSLPIDEVIEAAPAAEVESGNPVVCAVPEEPPIKVEHRPNPITIVIGKALKLKVKPKDDIQRNGTLRARAEGETTGPAEVKTSQNEEGVFEVHFNPQQPDYYVVEVKLNDENVPQSPFHVLYLPAPDQEPTVEAPGTEQLEAVFIPDKPIDYQIDLSGVPSGSLSAKCVGEECGSVPVTYEPITPDSKKYKVAFVPPQPDLYHLSVFFNDKELKSSPYDIDLRRKKIEEPVDNVRLQDPVENIPVPEDDSFLPDYKEDTPASDTVSEHDHTVEDVPSEEFTVFVGTPLAVKVHPKSDEQRNGELAATAIGDSVGSTDISCIRRDDIFFVRFDPKEPDRYTIDVKINDESVPRSPFRVNYIMPPTDASKCRLIGVKDIEDFVEVGTDVNLRVDSKKAGVGNLEVSAERPAEEEVASMLSASPSQKEWGLYDVVYIPQSHGKHSLDLKWADQTIPHSPVQILAVDSNRTETVPNGKAASVDIDADGNLKAHCIHKETNQNYKVKISKAHKGKYRITFQPKDIGLYFVHAFIKDKELPQSPFIIRYARPSKPEACKVLGLHDRCYLGETVSFKVDTREAGDGGLHIKTVGPDGKETAEILQLTDNKDGIHSAELTPAVPGMHELEITWGGKPVPGQPFPLFVRDHSKEELLSWLFDIDRAGDFHSVNFPAEGEELLDTTDHTLLLRVLARTEEQKREQLIVTAANSETGEKTSFAVTKKGEDTFEARFVPTVPQTYTIEAQLGASPVPHTPFKIKYETPKADAGKCQILGLEKHPDKFQANRPIVFQVDTRLAGNGKLNLAAEGVQLKPKLEARASKEDTRIIDVTYTPTAPGTHHLKVLWSGEPVAKSPLTFPVEAVPRFPHGKSVGYDLDIDAKQGDIDAHAIHVDTNSRLKVKTSKVSKGKYRFSFSPKKIGLYALHIFVKKREIKQSPIYILYEGPPKPEACVVKDLPNEWYIHEQGSFIVDATEAGSSSLSVKVSSPSRGKEGEVKVINNEDGTYTVEHTPEMLGNHKFSLTWAGKAIPDSPVTTSVKKRVPKAKACLGPYVNVVPVGERVELDVVNLGRYVGDSNYVTATARGKVGSDQPEVVDKDGLCIVNFVPTVADDYTLSVKIHDEDIEGSPFLIKSVDKPCLSKDYAPVEEACFSDVEVGKEVCLVVPKDEALPPGSEPVVEARGPEGPCEMKLIDQVESSYGVNFTPTVPGDYLVHVKKDRESEAEIESSPFKIRAIEKKSDAHKVIIPDSFQQLLVDPIPLGTAVKFEINTSEAGYGTLKVRQSGEGKATIKLTEEKDATYACSLVPTQIGSCQLDILWNDDHIRGSPLKLAFVPEPITTDVYLVENYSKPTQSEKPIPVSEDPITSLIGNPLLVRVTVCDELKDKEFTANAVGKETGPTDVAVTKLSSNVHEILLNPDAQDVYTVTAKVGDKEVPRSPVDVNYVTPASDPSKCFIVGIKELPPTLYVDKPISFKVHTEHAGPGDLGVTVDSPPTEEPPSVNVTQSPVDFVYDVSYTPKAPGQHSLSFLWAGDKIPDSPVQLKVSEPPTYGFGQPVGMDISADCKPGDLEAHAVHVDSNTPYKVKISKVHKGKYKLTLEPKDPGYYHIHVLLKQKEIPGSPFVVKYGEPAKPEKCTIHGQPDSVYVNRPINFVVDAKEAGSGKLSISASVPKSEPDESKPELKVNDNKDGTFGVEYVPNTVGKHSFGVLWSGQEIPDSPVNVDVREEGMDLTDLIDDFISSTPQSLPIDEVIEAAPAAEVESGNPAVPEEPPIEVERRLNPITIVIGKALKLKVKPKDDIQRNGTLRARAEGETTGPAEVKTSQNEEGVFEVYFNPPQPDYYVVEVKLNDENVPQSPFHVLYLPAPDQEPTVEGPGTEQLEAVFIPDKPIDYQIDLSGVPSGSLSSKCVGEECGSVPVTYEPITPDSKKYKVAFVPPQPDLYHLSVFFNDKELKGSPYDIDLRRKKIEEPVDNVRLQDTVENIPVPEDDSFLPDYKEDTPASDTVSEHDHTVEDVPSEEFTVFVGTPLAVKVHPKSDEQRNGELAATAIGDSVGSTDISCIRRDDIFFVRFDPKEPDRYTIDVKINDESVPRSPFRVNYIMPPTDASKCRLIGVKDIEDFVEVGTDVNLRVDSKKAGVGNLEVSAERPAEEEVASMLSASPSQKEWGLYDVVYIPQSHGKHSLDLKWADQTIPHSPVQILAVDSNRTETVPNGKAASVDIDADGNLKAHCIHKETNQNYKVKINKVHKGKYRITFQPKDIGLYFVHAYIKDKELPQSPFIIRYARPSKPEACKVLGLHDRCYLGETVSFKVDTREAGDGGLHIKTVGPDGKETAERLQLTDNKDGVHSAELTPAVPGMHELEITWGGKPVSGQPFPLFVRDHSKEELLSWLFDIDRAGDFHSVNFAAEGEELLDTTDHTLLLRVLARTEEQKREQLTVTAANSETGEKTSFAVTKKGEDTFEARFIPTVPQMYTIEAQLGASPVPHTPFKIKYETPKADAGKCQILGLEKHPDRFQANRPIVFQVDTRLAGNGKLNLAAEGVQLKPKLEARASKEDTRIIDVTYTPTAPGTHHLKVLWSGEPVAKSPLTFPVEAVPRFPHGKSVGYDLDIDAKQGDIDAHAIHVDTNSRLKVKTSKVSKGKYRFSFSPKKIGLYALHIFVKKREIKLSPIYILYEGPPKPEACVVKDLPNEWYIHEQGSFIVDATEAGSSSLSVKVSSPSRGKEGEVKVTNNEDGTYTVEHTPEVLGNHKFSLTWAGKAIPDSPVTTSVKKRVPKAKACLGPYVNVVPVGERVELDVVNLGRYVGDSNYVTATARGKVGSDQPEVVDKDGLCIVNFVPTVADDYTLSVKIHDEDIEGSPFLIKSVDKPCLSKDYAPVEEACFSDVEVGKEVCLVVPKDEALPPGSEPVVEARGPEGPCEMKLIDEVESSYGVNFTPTVPGDYLVHVKKDRESEAEIESSPFKIRAIEKKSDAHKVIIPDSFQQLLVDPIPLGTAVKFEINTSEAGYGTLKVRQSGEGKATIKLTEEKDAKYTCSLLPTKRGNCQIDILWNDEDIRGGPFRLMFVPIAGINLEGETFMVNTQNKFTVDRKSVVEGNLEIFCSDSQAADISIEPAEGGMEFFCIITVKKEGDYQIIVKYNDYHILGSPFNVHFQKPSSANMSFSLQAEGAEMNNVSATVQNSLTLEQLPVNLSDLFGGQYGLEFVPTEGLEYLVTIKCRLKVKTEEKIVAGSPFALGYEKIAGDASKCRSEGQGLIEATAGEWSSFFVYTEGAGSGELNIDIDGDVFGDEEAVITAISPTKFEVRYILRKKGSYQITVTWDGQEIPGSAFKVSCLAPEPDTNFAETEFPTEVVFGEPIAFTLSPVSSVDVNDIEVRARSKSKIIGVIPGTVTPAGGAFKCSINVAHLGKYLIEVTNKSTPLPGTPFIAKVFQSPKPENVRTSGPGLQDGFIGQDGNFIIETEQAGSGTLSLNVDGPKGGFKVNLDRDPANDRTILASYSPQNAGVYVISIKWSGVEIPGSPFQVNIKKGD